MFQAVSPPIIRSKNCTYSVRYCQLILLPAALLVVVLLRHYHPYSKDLTVVRETVGAANVAVIKEE